MKSLYKLTEDALAIRDAIIQNEGELTPELEEALIINQQDLEQKSANYALVIKDIASQEQIIDEAIKELQERKSKRQKTRIALMERIGDAMQEYGVTKVETPLVTLSFRKSTTVDIENEELIDEEYIVSKLVRRPDKTLIKKAIKEGKDVQGVVFTEHQNLQIK